MLVAQLQIRQQLSLMDRTDGVQSLDFHDYTTLHQNVQPESKIKPHSVVNHWNGHLHGSTKSSLIQFMHEASQIDALQKSGT